MVHGSLNLILNPNKKIIVFSLIVLFIIFSIMTPVDSLKMEKNITRSLNQESYNLIIKNISGGIGISFFIKNNGNLDIFDITIDIEVSKGFIRLQSPNQINVSELSAGHLVKVHIKIFGLEFGEPFEYNRIKIKISAPHIKTIQRIIVANVVGPFVSINAVFSNDEGANEGYTLFSPEYSQYTYLINNSGEIVHIWKSNYLQGLGLHLLENGNLIRTCLSKINTEFIGGGVTGCVEMYDWNNTLIWRYELTNNLVCLHHDIKVLPNGNILMTAWEYKAVAEAISAGRNPLTVLAGKLWPCFILEVEPIFPNGGNIVWEWHVWDHLIQDFDSSKDNYGIVGNHPELIDINFEGSIIGTIDYNHINSIDYNEKFDQILLSSYTQNEIWIIDHSTTTKEAREHIGGKSGKGGDLLYRWGNPQAYRAGNASDQKFFSQHDARWVKPGLPGEGNILVFNNGFLRQGPGLDYSSVDEIIPPVDDNGNYYLELGSAYGPDDLIWSYTADNPTDFYAYFLSSNERLPNGNTLICDGDHGIFIQVTPDKKIVWRYVNLFPDMISIDVFKIQFYPSDYPGLGDFNQKTVDINIKNKDFLKYSFINNRGL
jgi:hypothetical protein